VWTRPPGLSTFCCLCRASHFLPVSWPLRAFPLVSRAQHLVAAAVVVLRTDLLSRLSNLLRPEQCLFVIVWRRVTDLCSCSSNDWGPRVSTAYLATDWPPEVSRVAPPLPLQALVKRKFARASAAVRPSDPAGFKSPAVGLQIAHLLRKRGVHYHVMPCSLVAY
jgi:hypothetical protein